jgi:hypothetical protein
LKVQIVPAKLWHCGAIARYLRVEHAAMLMRTNVPIHRELRATFDRSYYRRAAFVDGHLAAVWGCEGSAISSTGLLWLAMSQYAVKFPMAVLRHARREIDHLAKTKTELVTTLLPDDEPAYRLAIFLGFEAPDGFGGGRARDRHARGPLMGYLRSNPDFLVSAGVGHQVGVVWRREDPS